MLSGCVDTVVVSPDVSTDTGADAYGRADSHWTRCDPNALRPAAAMREPPPSMRPMRTVEPDVGADASATRGPRRAALSRRMRRVDALAIVRAHLLWHARSQSNTCLGHRDRLCQCNRSINPTEAENVSMLCRSGQPGAEGRATLTRHACGTVRSIGNALMICRCFAPGPRLQLARTFYTAETRNCAFEGECIGTSKHHYSASWCRLCHISSGTFRHVSNVWNEAASLRQKVHHSSRPT
ncbi:hypothetical protein L1887_49522 [Cichorium endivia]|nr:hypothetical protein L1887_49522 [Cichorium endivia]